MGREQTVASQVVTAPRGSHLPTSQRFQSSLLLPAMISDGGDDDVDAHSHRTACDPTNDTVLEHAPCVFTDNMTTTDSAVNHLVWPGRLRPCATIHCGVSPGAYAADLACPCVHLMFERVRASFIDESTRPLRLNQLRIGCPRFCRHRMRSIRASSHSHPLRRLCARTAIRYPSFSHNDRSGGFQVLPRHPRLRACWCPVRPVS